MSLIENYYDWLVKMLKGGKRMTERKVIAKCCICGGLIYEGEAYRKVGLFKPKYAHEVCLQIKKAKAMALYAALSNIYRG